MSGCVRGVCGEVRGGVGGRGGMRVRGCVLGVRGACVGRVCWARKVGIARSALLSGYLGKSGHLPRLRRFFGIFLVFFLVFIFIFLLPNANSVMSRFRNVFS